MILSVKLGTLILNKDFIIVISDSLSLPRNDPEWVDIHEAYPSLLAERFKHVLNVGYGAATSENILWQANYFKSRLFRPIVILNFGIVDCTPRVLNRYESFVLKKMNITLPKVMAAWLRANRLTRKVMPDIFRENCKKIVEINLGKLVVLPIAPASDQFELEVPGIKDSINLYNDILRNIFKNSFCETHLSSDTHMMTDHHHLNLLGHKKVYESICRRIELIREADAAIQI